jgi:hypothetical protein
MKEVITMNISELRGPFDLDQIRTYVLPDEIIVTDNQENYWIARTHHFEELHALGYEKIS